MLRRLAVATLTWLCLASPSLAQGYGQRGGGTPGDFDFYVLALSWSPGFCELDGDRTRNREQCADGNGLRFVVHGLWPQYERGYPSDCSLAERSPSRSAMAEAEGVYPTDSLARYEWRKHGTCTGSSPADYFRDVRRARDKVAVPPALARSERDQRCTSLDLERAFVDAKVSYDFENLNPKLKGVSAQLNATNLLDKVEQVCSGGYCYFNEGRKVIASLRYRW